MINRRFFVKTAALASLTTAGYSVYRGVRIPPLIWEPAPLSNTFTFKNTDYLTSSLIRSQYQVIDNIDISFRAYSPEPSIQVQNKRGNKVRVSINNVPVGAQLRIQVELAEHVKETIDGITRILEIDFSRTQSIELQWQLAGQEDFHFAAIGDTGGAQELEWCIQRAHTLGALFLLHLGDINYQSGDYANAIKLFNNAPLPCYVSIGNHDFHDGGARYYSFLNDIGPLNHQFTIGKTRFVNLDTAANILPYSAGNRGRLFDLLIAENDLVTSTVAFTHKPLYDPLEEGDHDVGSTGERDWLVDSLQRANIQTLLSGHLHIFDRRRVAGIDNIIVGQGLGHQDLIINDDNSKMAIGHVKQNGDVQFEFAALAMPMAMHCHSRTNIVKNSLRKSMHADAIRKIDIACSK